MRLERQGKAKARAFLVNKGKHGPCYLAVTVWLVTGSGGYVAASVVGSLVPILARCARTLPRLAQAGDGWRRAPTTPLGWIKEYPSAVALAALREVRAIRPPMGNDRLDRDGGECGRYGYSSLLRRLQSAEPRISIPPSNDCGVHTILSVR